ncbi:MAG: hypothetical protein WCP99_07675 [Burkholderiales bacterium]
MPDFSPVRDSRPTSVRKLTRLWAWTLTATLSLSLPLTVVAADTSAAAQLARWSAVSLFGMPGAQAGEKNLQPATMLPSYQKECAACHTQAELGNYSERNIRIPKEIDRIVISAKP